MSSRTPRLQGAVDRLGNLGDPGRIARFLEEAGARGTPGSREDHPVAAYLRSLAPTTPVTVTAARISFTPGGRIRPQPVHVGCGDALRTFILAFNRGEYPELEEK